MKKAVSFSIFSILFCLAAALCFGQKNNAPVKPVQSKTDKAKTDKAKTVQTKTDKAKSDKIKTEKTKSTAAKTVQTKSAPVKASAEKAAKAKTASGKTVDAKTNQAKTSATKLVPAKTIPVKKVPVKTVPAKSAAVKTDSAKTTPVKTISGKTAAVKNEPNKTAAPKPKLPIVQNKPIATKEFNDAEWNRLAAALDAEDWEKSAALAAQFLNRMKSDNDKKQLARLRYLYLYALAGKVFRLSAAQKPTEEYAAREELTRAAARFTNKEFVLPARRFLSDCKAVVNYICTVKDGANKLFRTTATSKNGAEILSFDYVAFDEAIDLNEFSENKTFLGGTLRKAEFNDDLKQPWVMRLILDKGFVRVV